MREDETNKNKKAERENTHKVKEAVGKSLTHNMQSKGVTNKLK